MIRLLCPPARLSRSLLLSLVLLAAGCAHQSAPGIQGANPPSAEPAKETVQKPAKGEVQKPAWDPFLKQSLDAASSLEKKGEIARAVEELKIALTIDPGNGVVRDRLATLQADQAREARKRYQAGLALRGSDAPRATKEFLAALKILPGFEDAAEALREQRLLSAEALLKKRRQKEEGNSVHRKGKGEIVDGDTFDDGYSLERAVKAYRAGDFATAAHEFEKMDARYPHDPDIRRYLDFSLYQDGVAKYKRKDFKKALQSFSKVPKGFEQVDDYVKKCRKELKQASR